MANERTSSSHTSHVTRRGFFGGIGAGAAGLAGSMVLPQHVAAAETTAGGGANTFTRMFPNLPPFALPSEAMLHALEQLGAPGGPMDAQDPLWEGPVRLITNPELSPNNRDNPGVSAGMTFVGQFIDHDLTFDATSRLGVPSKPERSPNERTAAFDLDSVYGRGPTADSHLYDPADRARFKLEHGGLFEDLPRLGDGSAIIADGRNDEHVMIAGMHAAFLLFHNRVVDMVRAQDAAALAAGDGQAAGAHDVGRVFAAARRIVCWHYQWMVVHEFLPHVVGQDLVEEILKFGCRYFRPRNGEQTMPVEFQGAAFRFGHSLVRPSYRANLAGDNGAAFFGFIFDPAAEGQADPSDLRGGARAPRRFVGWQTFFDFGGDQSTHVRSNKRIDTKISTPLFNLPLRAIASGDFPTALPQRNLLRQLTWSLPSGQEVAKQMRLKPLSPDELSELAVYGVGLEQSTPLWYYILKEAELADGLRLRGVGARIVAEVILGLIMANRDSYLNSRPRWQPTLPSRTSGTFTMVDLLTVAGVDPASRGQ